MTDDTEQQSWGLVLSFTGLNYGETTEHAFVYGFEVGGIYERMKSGREAEIETTVHAINEEIYRRAAAAEGWGIEIKPSGTDGWSELKLTKKRAAVVNPNGLRVVR
jgi:hypothetical protein